MTEFAAAAAALALLVLGAVVLAGYQEVQRRALLAARQVAYTASWNIAAAAPAADARLYRAHFADAGVVDPVAGRAYVPEDQLRVETHWTGVGGAAADAAHALLDPLRATGGFGSPGFDLRNGGLLQGEVDARIAPLRGLPQPFDALDLPLREPFALLADAWHAAGPLQVNRRTSGLVPGARLAAVSGIWQALSAPLRLFDPSIGQLCLGLIEAERIPEDRLGAGSTPLTGNCP